MRNAVIRKKRLKAERAVDDSMRMPRRIVINTDISHIDQKVLDHALMTKRVWAHD